MTASVPMLRLMNVGHVRVYWAPRERAESWPGLHVWPGTRLGRRFGYLRILPLPRRRP